VDKKPIKIGESGKNEGKWQTKNTNNLNKTSGSLTKYKLESSPEQ